ncbi:MAG: hypothetical protein LLG14_14080 [Nocardiaceae bacterium]|nr:hypothetical protein [Nocardiaceae bacterium]
MLTAVGLVPSAPLLVPELSGAGNPDVDAVRAATAEVGRVLATQADRWTVLSSVESTSSKGTFRGFGADVRVSLKPGDLSNADPEMPLPLLIAAWLRTQTAPNTEVRPYLLGSATELFTALDESADREALLVVADGSTMLTPKAPGAFHPDAPAFEEKLDTAIEVGDWATVLELDGWDEFGAGESRPLFQFLAEVLAAMRPTETRGTHAAPFGVGYLMRTWAA